MNEDGYSGSGSNSAAGQKKSGSKNTGELVKIKDYNPGKHTLKVVSAKTGQPLEAPITMVGESVASKPWDQRAAKTMKTLDVPHGPIAEVTDKMASLRGSPKSGFFSTAEYGNIIKGPLSIEAAPHEIKLTGITTLNPLLITGFPSTIVTPIPTAIFTLPSGGLIGPIAKDVAVAAALLAAFGVG
jgi:hypothetical protein